jgi:hypothetical protein
MAVASAAVVAMSYLIDLLWVAELKNPESNHCLKIFDNN